MALETIEREHVAFGVSPKDAYDVVTDYACYPRVFPEFTGSRVLAEAGPRMHVEFRTRLLVEARTVLEILHDPDALATHWRYVDGNVIGDCEGSWDFAPVPGGARFRYRAGVTVKAPLPRFVVNKLANLLMHRALGQTFGALEREVRARRQYAVRG